MIVFPLFLEYDINAGFE